MRDSLTIVFSGEAGQGLQTIEDLIMKSAAPFYNVFSTSDVMSRIRGGNNTLEIRVSGKQIHAFKHGIDLLFLLNDHAYDRLHDRISEKTVILGEENFVDLDKIKERNSKFSVLKMKELVKQAGNPIVANTILFGFVAGILKLNPEECRRLLTDKFKHLSEKIVTDNKNAFDIGFTEGGPFALSFSIPKSDNASRYKVLNGNTAVGIGALAGGCNFISAYPMSPGTSLLEYLARMTEDFDIIVEQAEDEIAAINMVIGAWYAGGRGITTTSGGGFSLMVEGVSLSGMTETPCVIHVGQRPGPATGLPTRTEQADLNLAIHAGHGEFPRIIFAPGKLEDGVLLTQKAFFLADKYQVPVIVLTDQHFLESYGQMERLKLDKAYLTNQTIETKPDYKRYADDPTGISPRGIPGHGEGLVKVDSDEHDESGYITEDYKMRILMHEKRLRKKSLILEDYTDPELIGPKEYKHLIVGWGSTYGVLKEFIESSLHKDIAFLHIKQVYPLPEKLKDYFTGVESVISVENNSSGQMADLLKLELDIPVTHRILKYSGEPFSIEEMERKIKEVLK